MAQMDIRPATEGDYPAVRDFYYALTDEMADAPYPPGMKKDIYPTQDFLKDSIRQGELYLGFLDGALAACMVVNHAYNEGYRSVAWGVEAADDELLVIHALGVRRAVIGSAAVSGEDAVQGSPRRPLPNHRHVGPDSRFFNDQLSHVDAPFCLSQVSAGAEQTRSPEYFILALRP